MRGPGLMRLEVTGVLLGLRREVRAHLVQGIGAPRLGRVDPRRLGARSACPLRGGHGGPRVRDTASARANAAIASRASLVYTLRVSPSLLPFAARPHCSPRCKSWHEPLGSVNRGRVKCHRRGMRVAGLRVAGIALVAVLRLCPRRRRPSSRARTVTIAFVSGRSCTEPCDDWSADVFLFDEPRRGHRPITTDEGQHRHPTLVARSDEACLRDAGPVRLTTRRSSSTTSPSPAQCRDRLGPHDSTVLDDRPAWSPDGNRIAYETEVTNGSGQMDILVVDLEENSFFNLTQTPAVTEGKPFWSPDGKQIYYHSNSDRRPGHRQGEGGRLRLVRDGDRQRCRQPVPGRALARRHRALLHAGLILERCRRLQAHRRLIRLSRRDLRPRRSDCGGLQLHLVSGRTIITWVTG